jgi:hypothetical protein
MLAGSSYAFLPPPVEAIPSREWVFSDTDAACEKIAQIVAELDHSTDCTTSH